MRKTKDLFVEVEKLWCLFIFEDDAYCPLYEGNFEGRSFWRGGSNVSLAAYQNYQSAYANLKRAKKEFPKEKVVVRKISFYID